VFVPNYGNKFKKEYKLALKQGIKAEEIDKVLVTFIKGETLAHKHKDHNLIGNYAGFRECHIKNDYLLI
jgi:mRNA interferase YafQ